MPLAADHYKVTDKLFSGYTRFYQVITNRWTQWFKDHKTFSKTDLLKYADGIDDLFGHLYTIPVR